MITKKLDSSLRKINSVVIRLFLIVLMVFIYTYNSNIFIEKVYTISIILYPILLITHLYLPKSSYKGLFRLTLDLSLITIFLYGKDLNSLLNFFPFLILIFNTINHSNANNRLKVFIVLVHSSIILIDEFNIVFTHHLVPMILYVFIFTYSLRQLFQNLNADIIKLTGDLFAENTKNSSTHQILRKVKKELIKAPVNAVLKLEEIFLFRVINDRIVIIKGTEFVKETPSITKSLMDEIIRSRKSLIKGADIKINTRNINNSYFLKMNVYEHRYVFLLSLRGTSNFFQERIIQGLTPVFNQICRIFYLTNSLNKIKIEESKIIKEKVTYVLDAKNALHYVKNKLTPVTNTISLIDRYFKKPEELDSTKKEYIENKLKNNKGNVYIKDVIEKAEVLIQGIDNLLYKDDEQKSVKYVIGLVRQIWMYHFENVDDINIDIDNLVSLELNFNTELFEFIFTDIIENISKYSLEDKCVNFNQDSEGEITVSFINVIKDYNRKKDNLKEIVELYNMADNDEIYSRKTHGLSFIRRLMKRKKINNKISIDKENEKFIFKIKFKTI